MRVWKMSRQNYATFCNHSPPLYIVITTRSTTTTNHPQDYFFGNFKILFELEQVMRLKIDCWRKGNKIVSRLQILGNFAIPLSRGQLHYQSYQKYIFVFCYKLELWSNVYLFLLVLEQVLPKNAVDRMPEKWVP